MPLTVTTAPQGLGRREACLCFLWARTASADEIRSLDKTKSITFVDFLEALALVADCISPPTPKVGAPNRRPLVLYYISLRVLLGQTADLL